MEKNTNVVVLPVTNTVPLDQVGSFNYDEFIYDDFSAISLVTELVHDMIDQAASHSDLKHANFLGNGNENVEVATNNHQQMFENGLAAVHGQDDKMASHQQFKWASLDTIIANPNILLEQGKLRRKRKQEAFLIVKKRKLEDGHKFNVINEATLQSEPTEVALGIKMENVEMANHNHQTPLIKLEHQEKEETEDYFASWVNANNGSGKMFQQLSGSAFVSLENCNNLVSIKEELLDDGTVTDPIRGTGGWMCTRCNYASQRKYNVTQHIQYKHSSKRAFNCFRCSKPFKNGRDLQRHETKCRGEGQQMPGRPLGSSI